MHGPALQEDLQQTLLHPVGAITVIRRMGTAHVLSLAGGAVQQGRSPVDAKNIAVRFCWVSPSRSETAVRSHITKSILTVRVEAFLSYYARLCLTAGRS